MPRSVTNGVSRCTKNRETILRCRVHTSGERRDAASGFGLRGGQVRSHTRVSSARSLARAAAACHRRTGGNTRSGAQQVYVQQRGCSVKARRRASRIAATRVSTKVCAAITETATAEHAHARTQSQRGANANTFPAERKALG